MYIHSGQIYRLTMLLRSFGWTVIHKAPDLEEWVVGQCDYDKKTIKIDCAEAYKALMTLAHEAGHVVSYHRWSARNPTKTFDGTDGVDVDRREELAYLYGWAILRFLGAQIAKQQWKKLHERRLK